MSSVANGHVSNEMSFEEVEIPVPWGHISGKWWGSKVVQPILAVHGWQDNAGTFDNLAPLLAARGHSLLCIDLPGHGCSSPLPPGQFYYVWWDGVHLLRRIVKHFGWTKITLLGHSLGGGISFLYAASFPDSVDRYISLDIASPSVRQPMKLIMGIEDCVDKFLKYETLTPEQQPCYNYDEMLGIVYDAYAKSVTQESCKIMMRRGTRPAPNKPGYYLFTRDPRLKVSVLGFLSPDVVLTFATRIECKVCNIRANPHSKSDFPEMYDKVMEAIGNQAEVLERHLVDGTHHLHLNDAGSIVDIIDNFLKL